VRFLSAQKMEMGDSYTPVTNISTENQREVIIHDYVDETLSMTMRMFQKRLRGYHAIGYQVEGVDK